MKKVICVSLIILMLCCFVGCGNGANYTDEIDASELIEKMVMSFFCPGKKRLGGIKPNYDNIIISQKNNYRLRSQ